MFHLISVFHAESSDGYAKTELEKLTDSFSIFLLFLLVTSFSLAITLASCYADMEHVVSPENVREAMKIMRANGVRTTPLVEGSASLIPFKQIKLFFKLEPFQRTGSFKIRGATNAIHALVQDKNAQDIKDLVVVTVSSGNFAQGVALAARNLGLNALIIMPNNTSKIKVAAVQSYGAKVIFCEPNERNEHTARIIKELGPIAQFIHPSENPNVIAGNGTLFLEMFEQCKQVFSQKLHVVVVPIGGGGVISGVAAVARELGVLVVGGEPLLADDAFRSIKTGSIQHHRENKVPTTIAEGLRTTLGPNTFPCVRDWVSEIILVSEEEIQAAMKLVMERLKVVAEASSCVAYAAVRNPKFAEFIQSNFSGKDNINVGIVLTGGNVDLDYLPFQSRLAVL